MFEGALCVGLPGLFRHLRGVIIFAPPMVWKGWLLGRSGCVVVGIGEFRMGLKEDVGSL
jgi:hypothetical protein